MKKLFLAVMLAVALGTWFQRPASAADITITVTAQQVARLTTAFRAMSGNPDAGLPELKTHLIRELRAIVLLYEKQEAEKTIAPVPFDPS